MSDQNKPDMPDEDAAEGGAQAPADPPSMETPAGAEGEIPASQLKDIIAVLQAEMETVKLEKIRLIADMDNLRKRTERDKADIAKYAVTKFAQDIVGVVDNFERAAAAVPPAAADDDPVLKSFLEGVILAERDFLTVLERHGVKRIEAQGAPFNPHQHQAVMEREDTTVAPGSVLQVFQQGFMIDDRCLRPAMVVVSTGGAKAAREGEAVPAAPAADGRPGGEGPDGEVPGDEAGGSDDTT